MTNKTDKKTPVRLKKTKTQDNFFQMRDADGKSLTIVDSTGGYGFSPVPWDAGYNAYNVICYR